MCTKYYRYFENKYLRHTLAFATPILLSQIYGTFATTQMETKFYATEFASSQGLRQTCDSDMAQILFMQPTH